MIHFQIIFSHFNLLLNHFLYLILKNSTPYYFLAFCFLFLLNEIHSQKLELKIETSSQKNNSIIDNINYQKTHQDSTSLQQEIHRVEYRLKNRGYYSLLLQKIDMKKDTTIVQFSLGERIQTVSITIDSAQLKFLQKFKPENGTLKLPSENLAATLEEISNELEQKGYSFAEVSLYNTKIKDGILYANLQILPASKRTIQRVVVKGYEKFPNSYIKHFLKINGQTHFQKATIQEVSKKIAALSFVTETKPPETLFKKDSTLLYLYLKKKQNSSFDGLVNFNSNESGKVEFQGYLDIQLHSIFNKGEELSLLWNRFDEDRQELKIKTTVPFLLNSPISSRLEFSLYKQDSTFLTTSFKTDFSVYLNERLQWGINYESNASQTTQTNISTKNTADFSSQFVGLLMNYRIPLNDVFSTQKVNLSINPQFGQRTSDSTTSNQFKIDFFSSYLYEINQRNRFYLANSTGYLNSNRYLTNELYRIGGVKSIRGFNEQSLFASKYSFFTLEYHFLTTPTSFVYMLTDFGKFKNLIATNTIYGIGTGYQFIVRNLRVNISYSTGKINDQSFDVKASKIILNLSTFF